MNQQKKIASVLIIISLYVLVWGVVLELTKQRIQLEGKNRYNNLMTHQSPFVWDFVNFNTDIVTPFQKYWKAQKKGRTILAKKGSNPKLSLNFSGEKVNTEHFRKIQLNSTRELNGLVRVQVKVSHKDEVFYYTNLTKLSGHEQIINLDQDWYGFDKNNNKFNDFRWLENKNHISSLVLQFTNPEHALILSSVKLLTEKKVRAQIFVAIDCKGNYDKNLQFNSINYYIFNLSESCWLPSNYMWLKDFVRNQMAGSLLVLDKTDLIMGSTEHKVNKNYSQNKTINIIFYAFVLIFILIVYYLSFINKQKIRFFKENKTYGWMTVYFVILGVSFLLLVVMSWFKLPNISTFNLFPLYFLWALIQQSLLGYIMTEKLFFDKTQNKVLSCFFAATLFSLFHLPSITLVMVTLIAGFFWSYAWLTFKRIIPLAISHTLLALMFYDVISERILYSARVFHWFWE